MRTSTIAILLSLVVCPVAEAGSAGEVPPVDRVTVYADRAEVTRATRVDCRGGSVDVTFGGLPTSLDERTLRAQAGGRARAIGLTSRVESLEEDRDERVAALREQIQELQDAIRALQQERATVQERVGTMAAYGSYFQQVLVEQVRNRDPGTKKWAAVLDTMRDERTRAARRQGELAVALRGHNRKLGRLQRRLAALQPRQAAEARVVTVAVECRGEARPRVALSYVVPGATWHPEYDLRFLPRGNAKVGRGRAELTVAAVVQQATGEDWDDARLVLSTSRPRLGSEAPYPAPLYINGHEVGEERTLVATMEKREQLAGPAGGQTAGPAGAALEDRGQSFALVMPRRVTVRADGRPYWMPVDVAAGKAEGKLVTVPKMRPYVYQAVSLKNPAAYPLLPGRIHVYRRGSYVGDTRLEYKAPGEPMEISLGIDEELEVERKALHEVNRSASFLSSTKHLERRYRILLENKSQGRQRVEVRENIPVSKTEEVEIELVRDKTTPHFQLDRHRGFVTWTVPLAPGREKTVELAYTIHLPEDWKVQVR